MRCTICADRGIAWGEVLSEAGADNVHRDDIPDGDRWTAILPGGGEGEASIVVAVKPAAARALSQRDWKIPRGPWVGVVEPGLIGEGDLAAGASILPVDALWWGSGWSRRLDWIAGAGLGMPRRAIPWIRARTEVRRVSSASRWRLPHALGLDLIQAAARRPRWIAWGSPGGGDDIAGVANADSEEHAVSLAVARARLWGRAVVVSPGRETVLEVTPGDEGAVVSAVISPASEAAARAMSHRAQVG